MPKPRTRWTGLKHLGTIISHPQQYFRYKMNKAAFTRENHLAMHPHYAGELAPPHTYPGAAGNVRQAGVIYPPAGGVPATVVPAGTDLMATVPHDHQANAGVPGADLGQYRQNLVTLRQEAPGAVPVLRTAVKRNAHTSNAAPLQNIGRTQHSTLTGGGSVAAAALRMDAVAGPGGHDAHILMSSGHYQPDHLAAVKLAIAGKVAGSLNRRVTEFKAPGHGAPAVPINLTMKARMQVVSHWAQNH